MLKKLGLWRGLSGVFALLTILSVTASVVAEQYKVQLDALLGTKSFDIVTEITDDEEDIWTYKSDWQTAKNAYDSLKELSIRQAEESVVLLKNNASALPIAKTAKVTLLGLRSAAPVYGGNMASVPGSKSLVSLVECFEESGFELNPTMVETYASYTSTLTIASGFGGSAPAYKEASLFDGIAELSVSELAAINPNYDDDFADYDDAAIVVVGRPSSENQDGYRPGAAGLTSTSVGAAGFESTVTGNVLGLSNEEMSIINLAKSNFNKVIVLVNAANQMEINHLKLDDGIDAIAWVGEPGAYGFFGVANVLNGTVAPSGHLGDTLATNTALAPAMKNYGDDTLWVNNTGSEWPSGSNINGYLIQAEGIYNGYRYYETRYADIVANVANAKTAAAFTYAAPDGKPATIAGEWNYANEVAYPFGYGESYTTFEQTLNSVTVLGNRKEANVSVTVKNTGNVKGKDVVQVYAQTPYTQYDIDNKIEKSAVQLMDYEKTHVIEPGDSQTMVLKIDLANLASYDAKTAKTYILDSGDYYFAIGDDAHDALNHILDHKGYSTTNGMTENGDEDKAYKWTWTGGVDNVTFSVSKSGTEITNALSDGNYSMDYNSFAPNTVTYLTRNNWHGTFPVTYTGLAPTAEMLPILLNNWIELSTDDDVSDIVFGDSSIALTFNDMKGAAYDDPRWEQLLNKMDLGEWLTHAGKAFHNIEKIDSIGLLTYRADDGPIGADSFKLEQGEYQGEIVSDAADYTGLDYNTRVAPSPTNLAYTWNKELAYENGEKVIGQVSLYFRAPIIIGPGMNIHRHAYNARAHEYYSEDPILSGYTGSAVVQGAQSKGCLVNVKHFAFNDQELIRSGVSVFMTEQKAREMELRNFQQAIEGNGPSIYFAEQNIAYEGRALGVMTSFNRIGVAAGSANHGANVQILRNEWGFTGYSVTDFTGVSMKAAPKESLLYGTTAFCGFGINLDTTIYPDGWTAATFDGDRDILLAIKQNAHYTLWALANSNATNGINSTSHMVDLPTWWRTTYQVATYGFGGLGILSIALLAVVKVLVTKKEVA